MKIKKRFREIFSAFEVRDLSVPNCWVHPLTFRHLESEQLLFKKYQNDFKVIVTTRALND
jgi:hypothetical protein